MVKVVVGASSATASTLFSTSSLSKSFAPLQSCLRFSVYSFNSSFTSSSQHPAVSLHLHTSSKRRNSALKIQAKKGGGNDKKKQKVDTHSFVARPDEATGPFPEAVLLKPKKIQEDGSLRPDFADKEEELLYEYLSLKLESDLNLERMRHYEVVYLIHQDHKDEVENVNSKVQEFLKEKQGRLWRFSDWGMRRLAYKIRKATRAHYFLMNFELDAKWINDFKTMLDQDERVIRHLVIKRDKAITEDCPPPPEFHTIRGDMDENDEEYDDDDDEEEYDDDDDDLEYDDEYDDEEDEEWDDELNVQDSYDDGEDDAGNEDEVEDGSASTDDHDNGEIRVEKDKTRLMKKAREMDLKTEKAIR